MGLAARSSGGAPSTIYAFDERGNVAQRLDQYGDMLSADVYDAYGKLVAGGSAGDPWGFGAQAGYYTDAETGLVLLTHRFYDPAQGRFLTRDPAGYGGGVNLYGYVGNNPISRLDPSGLAPPGGLGSGIPPRGNLGGGYLKTYFPPEPPLFFQNPNAPGVINRFGNKAFKLGADVFRYTGWVGTVSGAVGVAGDALYLASPDPGFAGNALALGTAFAQAPASAGLVYGTGLLGGGVGTAGAVVGGLGVAGAIAVTAVAGWRLGSEIADLHVGPGGQTVSDFWADQITAAFIKFPEDTPAASSCR